MAHEIIAAKIEGLAARVERLEGQLIEEREQRCRLDAFVRASRRAPLGPTSSTLAELEGGDPEMWRAEGAKLGATEERAAVVKWLRNEAHRFDSRRLIQGLADAIERGEHAEGRSVKGEGS